MIAPIEEGVHAVFEHESRLRPSGIKAAVLSEVKDIRRVVQYSFYSIEKPTPQAVYRLVAKFYSDETGNRTFEFMKRLNLQQSGTLAVPAPLFYDAVRRVLVMQEAEGTCCAELVQKSGSENWMQLAGRALSQVHHVTEANTEHKKVTDHIKELIRPSPEELADHFQNYRPAIESALQTMKEREKQWEPHIQEMPIHRDFHLKQMFYENGRIWVVDWDLFCKGDPALDIGNFLVYLETHVSENSSHLIHAFLTGYFLDNSASVFRRVWLYKGFTYLRLACKSFRLQQGVEKTKEMLSQMERCFEREDH